jgi:CDGSH-type Zn-finger protein
VGVIRLRQRGPYVVETAEDVKVVDWNGNEYEVARRPVALCRCEESAKKPSCNATHVKVGVQASEVAVPVGDMPVA